MSLVINKFNRIDALVNAFHYKGNSRMLDTSTNFFVDFENYPEEAWNKVHDVNLKGAFLLSQMIFLLYSNNIMDMIVYK